MKDRLLLIGFVVILLVFGVLAARKFMFAERSPAPVESQVQPAAPVQMREILLYFAAADGPYLLSESREIEDCHAEKDCLERTIGELIAGPEGALLPVLPPQSRLRQLTVEGDLVIIDFSRDFIAAHPGGSMTELLTVYGLIDSLAVNFPYVRQLRILVEGEPVETIKGHVDLRSPVSADFSYTRSVTPASGLAVPLFETETTEPSPSTGMPPAGK